MIQTLYATFADASLAEKAIGALLDYGVRKEDISVIVNQPVDADTSITDSNGTRYIDNNRVTEERINEQAHTERAGKSGLSTTTPGDAAAGAAKGAGIGLGLGILAALAAIMVPGVGLVAGGGALATAIAGAAGTTAAGAVAGGVTGYLKDQGVPDEAVANYRHAYEHGAAILTVHVPSGNVDQMMIENILEKYQANDVSTYGATSNIYEVTAK